MEDNENHQFPILSNGAWVIPPIYRQEMEQLLNIIYLFGKFNMQLINTDKEISDLQEGAERKWKHLQFYRKPKYIVSSTYVK